MIAFHTGCVKRFPPGTTTRYIAMANLATKVIHISCGKPRVRESLKDIDNSRRRLNSIVLGADLSIVSFLGTQADGGRVSFSGQFSFYPNSFSPFVCVYVVLYCYLFISQQPDP